MELSAFNYFTVNFLVGTRSRRHVPIDQSARWMDWTALIGSHFANHHDNISWLGSREANETVAHVHDMEPASLYHSTLLLGAVEWPGCQRGRVARPRPKPAPRPPLSHPVVSAGGQREHSLPPCQGHRVNIQHSLRAASPGFVIAASAHDVLLTPKHSFLRVSTSSQLKRPSATGIHFPFLRLLIRSITERHPF